MIMEHKTAIVTGASSGIGRQTSILLATEGYHLTLVARDAQKLDETVQMARQAAAPDISFEVIPIDLSDPQTAATIVAKTSHRFGRIDAIANVAGYAPMMSIEQVTPEIWQKVVDTNLMCIVNLTAAAWPILSQHSGGVIVNVSSMASIDPFPGLSIYATVKSAVNMFTRCTAQEGEEVGIKAVAIAPGAVETPMLRSLFDEAAIPPNKTLSSKEVARTIVDCMTGSRSFEPGETILLPSPE